MFARFAVSAAALFAMPNLLEALSLGVQSRGGGSGMEGHEECLVVLPLLHQKANINLDMLCEEAFSKNACGKARAVLTDKPWTPETMRHACAHLGSEGHWREHVRLAPLLLLRRGSLMVHERAELNANLAQRLDTTLARKGHPKQAYVAQPPYKDGPNSTNGTIYLGPPAKPYNQTSDDRHRPDRFDEDATVFCGNSSYMKVPRCTTTTTTTTTTIITTTTTTTTIITSVAAAAVSKASPKAATKSKLMAEVTGGAAQMEGQLKKLAVQAAPTNASTSAANTTSRNTTTEAKPNDSSISASTVSDAVGKVTSDLPGNLSAAERTAGNAVKGASGLLKGAVGGLLKGAF